MSVGSLTEPQLQAAYDILSHAAVYAEIQDFRYPKTLDGYGPPFGSTAGRPSNSPTLQALVSKFVITLPGLKNVSPEFWNQRIDAIIEALEEADLSESYDKGTLGIRKTLATAISALVEYPVRGVFGGFDPPSPDSAKRSQYDKSKAAELERAFKDVMTQSVYGSALDDVFTKTSETDQLTEHSLEVQAAHEYVLVNLASFMHYTLIKSPKGQQLLMLIDHVNRLVPYTMIRQTLKIGNVASMINAMVKVVLAKMSVASVTNWMGFTQNSDEGMNLLQNIISTVLHWDMRELKHRANKIEKSKEAPSKEQMSTITSYLAKSRDEHDALREHSMKNTESMVHVILKNNNVSAALSSQQHALLLEYLSLLLAVRDRHELIRILCHSTPDHLTQSVRDLVSAYEPMIRSVHNAVDLSETLYDFEVFLRDMIKLSKLPSDREKRRTAPTPTVGDFVQLLKKHMYSSHKFLHQVAKNSTEVTKWFQDWANHAARQFQRHVDKEVTGGAGDLSEPLSDLWKSLEARKRAELVQILDAHAAYLSKLHAASSARLRSVVSSPTSSHPALKPLGSAPGSRSSSPVPSKLKNKKSEPRMRGDNGSLVESDGTIAGPGAFLARWQHLLDATLITPAEATGGKVRGGGFKSVLKASEKTIEGSEMPPQTAPDDNGNDMSVTGKEAAASYEKEKQEDSKDPIEDVEEQAGDNDDDLFEDAAERLDELGLATDDRKKQSDLRVDTKPVVEALGSQFRELLAKQSCDW